MDLPKTDPPTSGPTSGHSHCAPYVAGHTFPSSRARKLALLPLIVSLIGFSMHPVLPADAGPESETQPSTAIRFNDVTAGVGIEPRSTLTWGSTWVDHDEDGDPDLFANRHWKRPRFYLNHGGRFVLSAQDFFSGRHRLFDRHSCAWGEANGDGRVDFYCDSGAQRGEATGANQLWIQTSKGLVNRSKGYSVGDTFGRSRSVNWLDFDTDGDLDIFVGNKFRAGHPNVMFRNDRGSFTRVTAGLDVEMNTLHSAWSDWDRDGDPDLLILSYLPEPAVMYENIDGEFSLITVPGLSDNYWSSASWGDFDGDGWTDLHLVAPSEAVLMKNIEGEFKEVDSEPLVGGASSHWMDVDNDGDLDIFVIQGKAGGRNRPDFYLVQGAGTFTRVEGDSFAGSKSGSGEAATVADYDGDGRLDLFVTNGSLTSRESLQEGEWVLLRNRSDAGSWITIDIRGTPWNPWGYGGRLHVVAGELEYEREITDAVAFRSQSQVGRMLFGVGDADAISIRLSWPDGVSDCIEAEPEEEVVIRHGESPCS